jgi:hypothetical protein
VVVVDVVVEVTIEVVDEAVVGVTIVVVVADDSEVDAQLARLRTNEIEEVATAIRVMRHMIGARHDQSVIAR